MRISVGMTILLVLAIGAIAEPSAFAQEEGSEEVEEQGAPRQFQIGDFLYRLGPGMPWGPFRFHPYAAQYFVYDDNIFLTDEISSDPSSEEVAEMSSETTLGLRIDSTFEDHFATVEYQTQIVAYLLEGTSGLVRQMGMAQFRLDFARPYFDLRHVYRDSDDPVVEQPDLDRFRRATNYTDFLAGLEFEKLGIEAGFHNRNYDFKETATEYLDHNEFWIHGRVFYQMSPKLAPYGQVDYGASTYGGEESTGSTPISLNDYSYIRLWLGAISHPAEKASIHGRIGVMLQSVDEDSGTNPDDEEFQGAVAALSVEYNLSPKTRLGVGFIRDVQFSGTSNYQLVDRFELRLDYRFTERVLTSGLGFFESSDPSATDAFQRFGLGVILDYRLKDWIHLGVQYQHRQRTAKEVGDYTNNRFLGNVTVFF
ncbi:MAG: outer membrane beta-barrel protein [Planctomycetota bacterium]|nr:outer membrane beta-barrel protein [Planctomycetota bacterium]